MILQDKIVLVTGAARRVGRAIAEELAARGANLAIHYRSSEKEAEDFRDELRAAGHPAEIFQADLTVFTELDTLIDRVSKEMGGLDVLINSASIYERTTFNEVEEADWDRHLDTNLKAPFFLSKSAARIMRERGGGRIINIADAETQARWPGFLPYGISKAGLLAMTRGLAKLLAPDILVNAIGPGNVLLPEDYTEDQAGKCLELIPLKRFGDPKDIARLTRFLIEEGDYITGAFIPVDGGYSIR